MGVVREGGGGVSAYIRRGKTLWREKVEGGANGDSQATNTEKRGGITGE